MVVFGHGLWCCPSFAGCLWCSWLALGFGLLMGRVWLRARTACPLLFPVPVCGVGVRAGPVPRLCPAFLGWVVGVCFLRFFFLSWFGFVVSVAGCPCPGPCGPCPLIPFLSGWAAGSFFFFSWCVSACFGVPFPAGPLFLAWCCWFWLGGPPLPLWGSCLRCLLGGGFGRPLWCWRVVWWLWAVFARPPPPPPVFFFGLGACLFLPLPSLGWRTHWPAFSVVFGAAGGGCVLFGRVLAPWLGWAMYTLGSTSLPGGLGPGSAGWAAAPGGCVWLWVRALGLFVSFLLCGTGFNLLGGPPPLLPVARWPRVWPAVPVCGVLVRRLPGCAAACFG